MNKQKTVIMAEFSDVRYDARVLKESNYLSKNEYFVHLHMYNTSITKKRIHVKGNVKYYEYPFKNRRTNKSKWGVIKKYSEALFFLIRVNSWILFKSSQIYHAHNMKFLLSSFLSAIIHKGKFIYDAHEIHSEHYEKTSAINELKNKLNMLVEKLILSRCDAFIQASEERAAFIEKKYKIPKPFVINNYVPLQYFNEKGSLLHDKLGLNPAIPTLFYSGGIYIDRFNGFRNILKALVNFENINFVIVGFMNNEIKIQFDCLIKKYSLIKRIYILPPVNNEDLLEYASCADIGIIPLMGNSLNTKFSALNKVSEYMMAGLPILCSNYDNLRKIVYDNPYGKVGETFDITSSQSISQAIEKALRKENYTEYKKNALMLAHNVFNWENEEVKLKNIYETINTTT